MTATSMGEWRRTRRGMGDRGQWGLLRVLMLVALMGCTSLPFLAVPEAAAAGTDKGPDYGKGTITFLSLIRDGKYDNAYAYCNDEVSKALKPKDLSDVWRGLTEESGSFRSFGTPTVSAREKLHVVEVPVLFLKTEYTLRVAWDADGAIAGFRIVGQKDRTSGSAASPSSPSSPGPPSPATPAAGSTQPNDFLGHWEGNTETPGGPLPIRIDLARKDTTWTGTWDSPAQGVTGLPMANLRISGDGLQFSGENIPGNPTWKGKLEDGKITGTLSQSGIQMPFLLSRDSLPKPARPQEPKPPFPYKVEEVAYNNGEIKLAGTLTIPEGAGPFPAALLITGSGAENRDEEVFGHKPFLVLADFLTRAGIAVLRVDDRGVGGSGGRNTKPTSADFAQDVLKGVAFLRTRPEVDPKRIGLIGHSEGGLIGPMAASQSKDVAYVVMLAGPGVPGDEIIARQTEVIVRAQGMKEDSVRLLVESEREIHRLIKSGADSTRIRGLLFKQALAQLGDTLGGKTLTAERLAQVNQAVDRQTATMTSPWVRYFIATDPRQFLRKVSVPVLAINGELDFQVDPDQNLPEIEKALMEGGNKDVTIKRLPGLNHLFQHVATGKIEEYAKTEETMNPVALQTVRDWITERFGKK